MAFSGEVNLQELWDRERRGYVTCRGHPLAELVIWNYTPKCQFDAAWDEITVQARGLITTREGIIVARPFPKFFGIDQYTKLGKTLPDEPFEITEKLDGSLGIAFHDGADWAIATRGSFTSEQAIHATHVLRERYSSFSFDPALTHLFEIVYQENRVVVDYGDLDDLILLAVIDTETGAERSIHDSVWPFPVARRYDGVGDMGQVAEMVARNPSNAEGFVVRFIPSNVRVKCKYADYVRLHHTLTGTSARDIWDILRRGASLDPLLDRVPDEFYDWVERTAINLHWAFRDMEERCRIAYMAARGLPDRKAQAAAITTDKSCVPAVVFKMLDGKPYDEIIWNIVRPVASRPFKIGDE